MTNEIKILLISFIITNNTMDNVSKKANLIIVVLNENLLIQNDYRERYCNHS